MVYSYEISGEDNKTFEWDTTCFGELPMDEPKAEGRRHWRVKMSGNILPCQYQWSSDLTTEWESLEISLFHWHDSEGLSPPWPYSPMADELTRCFYLAPADTAKGFCQICCCWAEYRQRDSPCPFCFINYLDNEAFTPSNGAFRLRVRAGGLNESHSQSNLVSNSSTYLSSWTESWTFQLRHKCLL